ncbi:MAG: hypothetical protein A2Z07_00280 [Armatimonadetes bacterium RBG_16_67_12]|nr:MAG: hypothetical protein A2Z07_00280 [Armatimonadetes bacterium RBG_16_67_12]
MAPRADGLRQARCADVEIGHAISEAVPLQPETRAAEGVGFDDVASRIQIGLVDGPDDVGVCLVPQLRAGPTLETRFEQHRSHSTVEDQNLGLQALKQLRAMGIHGFRLSRPGSGFLELRVEAEGIHRVGRRILTTLG